MNVEREQNLLPVKRAGELLETPPELRFLVEGLWMADSVGVIGGSPKSCKTWAGLDMAVSIASGSPCLGRFVIRQPGPTMIYLAEDALPMVRERLEALCNHRGLNLEELDLHVITAPRLRLDTPTDQRRLQRTLNHYRPKLLLLDPFVRLHNCDENQSTEITPLLAYLRQLQRQLNVSIVLVHHMRKSGSSTQRGQALRGSGDIHAWLDSAWYITHERQHLKLTVEHRAAPTPEPLYLKLNLKPLYLKLIGAPKEAAPTLEERVLSTLKRAPAPLNRTQLRKHVRVNNARLGDTLKQLELYGKIKRTRTGFSI